MSEILIKGGRIEGEDTADILVKDHRIVAIGKDAAHETGKNSKIIDASGLIVLPGLVDLHTHLREPGNEDAETVFTGTRTAAVGGYTCVHAMANTTPVADNASVVEQVQHLGDEAGWVDVRPVGAVSKDLSGHHLASLGAMAKSKARVRVFSDDGNCVSDPMVMRRALEYVRSFGGVIAQHAQDPRLTEQAQMNEGVLSGELGLTGWPAVAEESIIARDVLLAQHVGSRLHVCHLSTAGSVDIIRWAKKRGIQVTAEVTPHHLFLSEQKVSSYDPRYKVNPPLRSEEDIEAVRQGLADGTIDIVGTDHAPHPLEAKDCEFQAGANGMTGLEAALPVVIETMVKTGRMNYKDVARVMSYAPARIGKVGTQGNPIEVGAVANLCLLDDSVSREVTLDEQYSRSTNTPYLGYTLPGQVMYTIYAGHLTVVDGVPTTGRISAFREEELKEN